LKTGTQHLGQADDAVRLWYYASDSRSGGGRQGPEKQNLLLHKQKTDSAYHDEIQRKSQDEEYQRFNGTKEELEVAL
jgi:hypothetical protein